MAYPLVASTSTGFANTGVDTATITAPTGMAAGDYLVAAASAFSVTNTSVTPPAGWTTLDSYNANTNTCVAYFAKYATAADVTAGNFVFTYTAGSNNNSVLNVGIARITGMDSTTAIDKSSFGHVPASINAVATTVTPTTQNLYLIFVAATNNVANMSISSQAITANNPSWTEEFDVNKLGSTGGNRTNVSLAWANQTAAGGIATGSITALISTSADSNLGFFAIKPAPTFTATSIPLTTTIGTPMFVRKMVATALTLTTTIGTPTISLTALWKNASKNLSTWVNQNKS